MSDQQRFIELPWQARLTAFLERFPAGCEVDLDRLFVLANPPSLAALSDELARRDQEGSLSVSFRISNPTTGEVSCELPACELLPASASAGDSSCVKVHVAESVEMVVRSV